MTRVIGSHLDGKVKLVAEPGMYLILVNGVEQESSRSYERALGYAEGFADGLDIDPRTINWEDSS